ncbi:hypothetical protein WOSG25_410010, partial [Weissella oryzae SG25]
ADIAKAITTYPGQWANNGKNIANAPFASGNYTYEVIPDDATLNGVIIAHSFDGITKIALVNDGKLQTWKIGAAIDNLGKLNGLADPMTNILTASSDLNNVTTAGEYNTESDADAAKQLNTPLGATQKAYALEVKNFGTSGKIQIVRSMGTASVAEYIRYKGVDGKWQPWSLHGNTVATGTVAMWHGMTAIWSKQGNMVHIWAWLTQSIGSGEISTETLPIFLRPVHETFSLGFHGRTVDGEMSLTTTGKMSSESGSNVNMNYEWHYTAQNAEFK